MSPQRAQPAPANPDPPDEPELVPLQSAEEAISDILEAVTGDTPT